MTDFIQPHPEPSNRFASDRTLHHTLERLLPAEVFADASPLFQRMGERAMQEIPALAATAEHNVPRHEPFFRRWWFKAPASESEGGCPGPDAVDDDDCPLECVPVKTPKKK